MQTWRRRGFQLSATCIISLGMSGISESECFSWNALLDCMLLPICKITYAPPCDIPRVYKTLVFNQKYEKILLIQNIKVVRVYKVKFTELTMRSNLINLTRNRYRSSDFQIQVKIYRRQSIKQICFVLVNQASLHSDSCICSYEARILGPWRNKGQPTGNLDSGTFLIKELNINYFFGCRKFFE